MNLSIKVSRATQHIDLESLYRLTGLSLGLFHANDSHRYFCAIGSATASPLRSVITGGDVPGPVNRRPGAGKS